MGSLLPLCFLLQGAAPAPLVPPAAPADPWLGEPSESRAELFRTDDPSPFSWGVLLRTYYTHAPSEASAGTSDVSGFDFEDIDVHLAGDFGDVAWRVGADFAGATSSGSAELEDAYAAWRHAEWFVLTAGQFRPRVVRSGSVPEDELLFRDRTFLGAVFDTFDDGVELGGHYDQFDWWLAVTDGADGQESDHFESARLEWGLYDKGDWDQEGARGAPNHLRVDWGVLWFQDASISTSHAGGYGTDLAITFGPWSFYGEWADMEEDFTRTIDVFDGHLLAIGDGKPLALTLGRRIGPSFEAAVRAQDADDADSTESLGLAASWQTADGLRLQADVATVEGDTRDFSMFSLGVVLGSSGRSRDGSR